MLPKPGKKAKSLKNKTHAHRWLVYSTAMCPPSLMVDCKCGAEGHVRKFASDDWSLAFHAPSQAFKLRDDLVSRVIVHKGGRYAQKT